MAKCLVDGCSKPVDARGYCPSHYQRLRRHGDPLGGRRNDGELLDWLKANIGHQSEDCLIWPFSRDNHGYGTKVGFDGRGIAPHRIMCVLAHGPSPAGKSHAAHSCGNGQLGCVNPRHLSWKSPKENTADRYIHGTMVLGESSPNAKLTEQDVLAIVGPLKHVGCTTLARKFGVSATSIKCVRGGKSWSWLTGIQRRRQAEKVTDQIERRRAGA